MLLLAPPKRVFLGYVCRPSLWEGWGLCLPGTVTLIDSMLYPPAPRINQRRPVGRAVGKRIVIHGPARPVGDGPVVARPPPGGATDRRCDV